MIQTKIATYLPPWAGPGGTRTAGPDEDAVTMAVAAGLAAAGSDPVTRVVLVTREPALVLGDNAAALCAGLGLSTDTEVVERLGGAPAALDAVATATPGTLVIGADPVDAAGSGAVLVGDDGAVALVTRVQRSLPVRIRDAAGVRHDDDDPRLQRERGTRASLDAAGLDGPPDAIAGLGRGDAKGFASSDAPTLPTTGASSPFFALAALAGTGGTIAAIELATLAVATFDGTSPVEAIAPEAQEIPKTTANPGPEIKVAFTAYDRAFEPRQRWEAGRCESCGTLAFPPRHRCIECGSEEPHPLVSLPRTGEVYTDATIRVPVPGLSTPYSLVIVELDDVGVRALVTVTDTPAGTTDIGDRGKLVFRRVTTRSGVPDYGYAFQPEVVR